MHDGPMIIWVNSPPVVERGPLAYLEDHWPSGVVYAVLGELRAERAAMGWDAPGAGGATLRMRGTIPVDEFADGILREFRTGQHLVAGISSVTGRALSRIVRTAPPERVAVFSERPGAYGPFVKRLLAHIAVPIKYSLLVRRYRNKVGLLLPLGEVGVETFVRLGWPKDKAAPYMYCPEQHSSEPRPARDHGSPVRFLYVGRLSRFTKGTDVLLKAVDRLRGDWSLTLVGGHGDLVEAVRGWAAGKANVDVAGAATPLEVAAAMGRHDICVVPSRFDGWNVVVNEALSVGLGVIVTDEAVSHELITISGAGIVVKARSARRLAKAMQSVIDEPTLATAWGARAVDYAPLISPNSVGQYLFDLLRSVVSKTPTHIIPAPWLRRREATDGSRAAE